MHITVETKQQNPMMMRRLLFPLALSVAVSIPTLAAARTPTGRRISGVVQKTNRSAREAEILRTDTGGPLSFIWDNQTTFVANMRLVSAAVLKQGAKVEVIYQQPFFGQPFATKVTLLSASEKVP